MCFAFEGISGETHFFFTFIPTYINSSFHLLNPSQGVSSRFIALELFWLTSQEVTVSTRLGIRFIGLGFPMLLPMRYIGGIFRTRTAIVVAAVPGVMETGIGIRSNFISRFGFFY
jgi:hypothetical protein